MSTASASAPGFSERQQKKILVVEDEPAFCVAYCELLKLEGYDARWVSEPLRAYDAAVEYEPDLIILNYMMQYLTGEDLLKIFHMMPATRNIPIIFESAHYERIRELFAQYQDQGVVGAVPKPADIEHLLDVVEKALGSLVP